MAPIVLTILPLIPHIIRGVEGIFGAKKGKEKKEASVDMIATLIKQARESGLVKDDDVNAQMVANIVEVVLATMKSEGTLDEGKDPTQPTPTVGEGIPITIKGLMFTNA